MVEFRLSPEAESEIAEAVAWYLGEAPDHAHRFYDAVFATIEHVAENPTRFSFYNQEHRYYVMAD